MKLKQRVMDFCKRRGGHGNFKKVGNRVFEEFISIPCYLQQANPTRQQKKKLSSYYVEEIRVLNTVGSWFAVGWAKSGSSCPLRKFKSFHLEREREREEKKKEEEEEEEEVKWTFQP